MGLVHHTLVVPLEVLVIHFLGCAQIQIFANQLNKANKQGNLELNYYLSLPINQIKDTGLSPYDVVFYQRFLAIVCYVFLTRHATQVHVSSNSPQYV